MRVRTGRFDGLRSRGDPGHPQFVEEFVRQRHVEVHRRVVPPPSAVACNLPGSVIPHTASTQLAIDSRTPLPVLELQRPQAMANPFVDVSKNPGRLGDPEVGLPPRQVFTQVLTHDRHAPPDNTSSKHADLLFHARQGSEAMRSLTIRPGAIQNEKPRNFRPVARATALLASLTRSFSRA